MGNLVCVGAETGKETERNGIIHMPDIEEDTQK
ncbi:hypothetical protein ALO_00375 [Acetonema longum DSM 6540]|uniref:Uncharacterized protein n=1 Tax=Acetonema longum DSM 6540 TaxID=1009370 RepID=F7NDG8_9FIRM|nr:hypothetical protein ALO_00375 [Acetonema longum DSM 6540]